MPQEFIGIPEVRTNLKRDILYRQKRPSLEAKETECNIYKIYRTSGKIEYMGGGITMSLTPFHNIIIVIKLKKK